MPRVVPSQVVNFINGLPPNEFNGLVSMNHIGAPALSSVPDLVERVPDEVLTMDSVIYGSLLYAKAQLRDILSTWQANTAAGRALHPFRFSIANNPLALICSALAKCPDESPAPSTSELSFIADIELRTNLQNDMGAVNRALSSGEWKAATVLAGSAIEALLLWALQQHPSRDITRAIQTLIASRILTREPSKSLESWDLHEYIEVAVTLSVIKTDTAEQTRLARKFRNLIHPGRAQRVAQICDRATALSAVAGVEHVIRDLTPVSG